VTYRFGAFTVDSDTRQLFADATEVHLTPKAFTLLLTLIEHRDRALSKTELQARLWPSTFIGETNLSTLVAELRRGLGDSAQKPACIRTVHRFGYRFVAGVIESAGAPTTPRASTRMYLRAADRQFLLAEGATTIGRGADAVIQIDAGGVSRLHARVVTGNGESWIEDLGSKNGTFVGGARIERARLLTDGDEIRVGPAVLTFSVAPATRPTETMT
jgi:DNA-binding winged helix-turn-helix (wHTH) protein